MNKGQKEPKAMAQSSSSTGTRNMTNPLKAAWFH